jgi:short-subunit dehydrogenase
MPGILIITGASKGIGYATAKLFIYHGWRVINISRHNCELAGVENFNIDLGEPGWFTMYGQKLAQVISKANKIALVHNAASYTQDSMITIEAEILRQVLEVSVVAATQLNKIFMPQMTAGSSVIYIGSTLSEKAVAGVASNKESVAAILPTSTISSKSKITFCLCARSCKNVPMIASTSSC